MDKTMNTIKKDSVEVNQLTRNVLSFIFMNKIRDLHELNRKSAVFSKQLNIRKLLDRINNFVKTNPYSYFEIAFGNTFSIKTRNFEHKLENHEPNYYKLVIDPTWSDYKVYQLSIDKLFLIQI